MFVIRRPITLRQNTKRVIINFLKSQDLYRFFFDEGLIYIINNNNNDNNN